MTRPFPRLSPGRALALLLIGCVRAYQTLVRPLAGSACRHVPSCSDYAIEALRLHGPLRGSWLAAGRILRCNPWHHGGEDQVPPPRPRPAG